MARKSRRRKLIVVETSTVGAGEDQQFGCKYSLPLDSANALESENAAGRIMRAVNAQLDFVGSELRLMMHDIKKREVVSIVFPD